ncbi:MAG: hypothetical protein K6E50_01815 [Lachnospiraceae bacterium]|nr:hypothetical protein [Lachnospiraceae bacterium]
MNPARSLFRVYRKNFEMPMPEEGVKVSLYTSLGIIAVTCIMLPCCIICGYISYILSLAMMMEGNRVNGLVSELHIISAFSMILGITVVFNVLFFSSDREHVVTLPINSHLLLAAKFFHTFLAESVMEFLVLFSMFIGYYVAAIEADGPWPALGPVGILAALLGTATLPLLPLIYCTLLSLVLMACLRKVRSRKTFYHCSSFLLVLFIALFLYSFRDMGGISMSNYVDSMVADSNFFLRVCNVLFFTTPMLCRAVAEQNVPGLLFYIVGNAAALGLMLLAGRFLYQEGLYTAGALGSGRSRTREKALNLKPSPLFFSYVKKELRVLLRTRAYSSNCIYINLLWPVGLLVFFHITRENETIQAFFRMYGEGYERASLILLLAVIVIAFIASALNTLASTAFTREGAHVDLIKFIPVSYRTQMLAKGSIAFFVTAPILILSVIIAGLKLQFSVGEGVYFSILSLAILLIVIVIGLGMDSASPFTLWDDEYSALRGNLNSFFNMAVMLVGAILLCGLAFLLYEGFGLPLAAVRVILLVLLLCADAAAVFFGSRIIQNNMSELF